jgi:hypothetical protein
MTLDSRRYHRRPRPPAFTRYQAGFSRSASSPVMFDPFGGAPFRAAGMEANQFTNPTGLNLGYGGGKSPYAPGAGPYGTYLNQVTPTLGSYLPSMTNLSTTLTSGANQAYGGYQNAVDQFMQKLPGFNASAGQATGAASTALEDAMSPLQSSALYRQASTNALDAARTGEAARGMVEGGQGQAGEQSLLSTLASNTLNTQAERQQAAIQGLTGATGGQAGIAGLGPQIMQSLFSAYPQLASLLTGAAQMPFQAGSDLMNFFQSAQNPIMSLLNIIKPQMGQQSYSISQNAGI